MQLVALLALCPCSGGGGSGGGDSSGAAWLMLAVVVGMWMLVRSIWKKKGASTMSMAWKIGIVVLLAAVVAAAVVVKQYGASAPPTDQSSAGAALDTRSAAASTSGQPSGQPAVVGIADAAHAAPRAPAATPLPRLVDLGAATCIPCKMMAPILDDLKKEYSGRMVVEVIDVRENSDAARTFAIRLIPTQIFIDASGKELGRHEGFISKEDILARWKELGVTFAAAPPSGVGGTR